jgi:hypothetical protein
LRLAIAVLDEKELQENELDIATEKTTAANNVDFIRWRRFNGTVLIKPANDFYGTLLQVGRHGTRNKKKLRLERLIIKLVFYTYLNCVFV